MTSRQDDPKPTDHWGALRAALNWDDGGTDERELLRQRAQQYAQPVGAGDPATDAGADALTLLTFRLGKERYGVDVMAVRGVRVCPRITPVPAVPPFYRGVVNVRGQILSVLDLSVLFEVVRDPDDPADELVIVSGGALEIGLCAGQVLDVVRLPRQRLQPFDHLRYALGVTVDRLVVLDLQGLLQDERLIVGSHDD